MTKNPNVAERKVLIQIDMLGRSGVIEAVYVEHMGLGLHRVKVQPWQKKLFEAIGHEVYRDDTVHLWMNQFRFLRERPEDITKEGKK